MKPHRTKKGSALIIVLAFVLLLTLLAVAFLARIQASYPISNSSANGSGADLFSRGALDQITGDLKQEIAAGSTGGTGGSPGGGLQSGTAGVPKVYLPYFGGQRANILPYPVNGTTASMNVVKESLNTGGAGGTPIPFYAGGTYDLADYPASARASAGITTTPSLNGRSVSLARWNTPLLMPPNADTDYTPSTAFQPPNWVYMARNGTNPAAYNANMADATATNDNYVVGRYAYVMYDEAALLDVNAAGGPSPANMNAAEAAIPPTINLTNAKGSIGLADMTTTGLAQTDVDALTGWRNMASAQPSGSFPTYTFTPASAGNYLNVLLGASGGTLQIPTLGASSAWAGARKTGFLTTANAAPVAGQTDHLFDSRQELIQFLLNETGTRFTVEKALQYLGTSSLALNSPAWVPKPLVGTKAYGSLALNEASIFMNRPGHASNFTPNQFAPAVQVQNAFTRDDGTIAKVGDPLMKYRFPLRRLEWFNQANQTAYAAQIRKSFCLAPATGVSPTSSPTGTWNYYDPESGLVNSAANLTIKNLDQVASLGREPTFWEVLQAAILSGSLAPASVAGPFDTSNDHLPARQILQIGLNIIDQYNTNATPTVVTFGALMGATSSITPAVGVPVAGIKNLPYLMGAGIQFFSTTPRVVEPPDPAPQIPYTYLGYIQFLLWNPTYNLPAATQTIRLVVNGNFQFFVMTGPQSFIQTSANCDYPYGDNNSFIQFNVPPNRFQTIDLITPTEPGLTFSPPAVAAAAVGPSVTYTPPAGGGPTQMGIRIGESTLYSSSPQYTPPPAKKLTEQVAGAAYDWFWNLPPGPVYPSYRLEVRDAAGNWIPYQVLANWNDGGSADHNDPPYFTGMTTYMNLPATQKNNYFDTMMPYIASDPRVTRLGWPDAKATNLYACGYAPMNNSTGKAVSINGYSDSVLSPNGTGYPGAWAFNQIAATYSPQTYVERDGMTRKADGNLTLMASTLDASPYHNAAVTAAATTPAIARPYQLNKSFNSVADMGYAGRDEPWKTLNFYSADSADCALLDYFSLSESSAYAGGININTASTQVLAAMLRGSSADVTDPTPNSQLTPAQANTLATAIRAYLGTSRGAMLSGNAATTAFDPSDIATINANVSGALGPPTTTVGTAGTLPLGIKRAQEVVARSFADSWNTRTWNLMIDLVAQTGRFPKGLANPSIDNFVVTGERRQWAHVAIDRFTGQVLSLKIEPVNE